MQICIGRPSTWRALEKPLGETKKTLKKGKENDGIPISGSATPPFRRRDAADAADADAADAAAAGAACVAY